MTILKRLRALFKSRPLTRSSVDTRYALAEACLIGLLSALAALCLKEGIGWLGGYRIKAATYFGAGFALPVAGLTLGLLAGWLVEELSPESAKGGIPQVKAVLARFPVLLSLRVALVKAVGTILVLGSGLTLGRRGPTVHIGAALAAQLSSWMPTSPEHRRQMIAAGAAAGLAAGFNTPIAGVLFVVEELMRDISGLTLQTAILASFIGAVVSRLLGSADLNLPTGLLDLPNISFSAPEIPFYLLLGALAGILGGLFNRGILLGFAFNRRLGLSMPWRIGLAGLISGTIVAFLPPFFRDNAGLREFLVTGELDWQTTALAFVAHFFLTILAASSGAPGGLFAPALVLGSALGYLIGDAEGFLTGTGAASTYALAGMGAFFTAVVRVPVTAIVIVFEINANFNLVLPLMISSAVAYIFAEIVSRGSLYEHLLEASGIELKEETTSNHLLIKLTAADVMQPHVETLSEDLTLDKLLQAMSRSHHRGFPVVEEGKLVGIVTQSDLEKLTTRSGQTPLREIMTPQPIKVTPTASLSDVLYLLNRYQLSRLPVTEGYKLVGIITRTDIIRAEVKHLGGEMTQVASKPAPSYVVYQTRSPALGKGRILLPLSNPQNAPALLQIAAAIARHQQYELECLQVIEVPKHSFPAYTQVNVVRSRKLMHRVERLGRNWNIPVHTQIRVAQDTGEAILETIAQRHINLILMGWKGSTSTQGAIFGNVVDTLIHKAPCDVILVKLGQQPNAYPNNLDKDNSWLIAMAGGPNAQRAVELLPALTALYTRPDSPKVWLCQIHRPSESDPDCTDIEQAAQLLTDELDMPSIPICIRSYSVPEAVIHLATAEKCDVVMLGASREGLLQQAIHGNIPEAIARGVDSTVILVRGAIE
ncbi:MAG: chloride channel protein [Xenococcaceae cyanobacterium]